MNSTIKLNLFDDASFFYFPHFSDVDKIKLYKFSLLKHRRYHHINVRATKIMKTWKDELNFLIFTSSSRLLCDKIKGESARCHLNSFKIYFNKTENFYSKKFICQPHQNQHVCAFSSRYFLISTKHTTKFVDILIAHQSSLIIISKCEWEKSNTFRSIQLEWWWTWVQNFFNSSCNKFYFISCARDFNC